MFNTNWSSNHNTSTSNVDWSALADTWLQQREQQAQWQQVAPPPPLPPPPPPPQFLINAPPIRPPGPPPIGMQFPPLPPTQIQLAPIHHQLQVGSNTTQESLTMTNFENQSWRPPIPPPLPPAPNQMMMQVAPQWRPNTNNNQPLFPIQKEAAPSFSGRNYWPPTNAVHQPPPPPVIPAPTIPPLPLPPPPPPQFPSTSYQHSPVDKRSMNSSFNTSIPSLMDLPSSYRKKPVVPPPPPLPVPILPVEVKTSTSSNASSNANANAKRRKIPAWLREELGRIEKEKEKKSQNTSANTTITNNNTSITSSKFDDSEDEDNADADEDTSHHQTFSGEDDDENENENENKEDDDDDDESSSTLISSTPIGNRRSRFDDDQSTDQQLNVSAISKRAYSPSSPTTIDEDPVDKEEQFMMKLRRALTELLLEVTNEEIVLIAKEVHLVSKTESSTPVIRKASGLSSLIQSFSGSDSDSNETEINPTTPIIPTPKPSSENNQSSSSKSKSSHERTPKKHHHKKHRHHSSSSSSSPSSEKRSHKKKKHDDRGRKH